MRTENSQADHALRTLFQQVQAPAGLQQSVPCPIQVFCGLPARQLISVSLVILQRLEPSDTETVVCLFQYLSHHSGKAAVFCFTQLTICSDLRIKVGLQNFF